MNRDTLDRFIYGIPVSGGATRSARVDAGGWHQLDVSVKDRHAAVTARRGYDR
jgi:hypothetical protein